MSQIAVGWVTKFLGSLAALIFQYCIEKPWLFLMAFLVVWARMRKLRSLGRASFVADEEQPGVKLESREHK